MLGIRSFQLVARGTRAGQTFARRNAIVWNKVVIVGVGLLGGSVGLAIRQRGLAREIVGVDRDEQLLATARELKAIDSFSVALTEVIENADWVVISTPVDRVCEIVWAIIECDRFQGTITDVGSTKSSINSSLDSELSRRGMSADSFPFVGSHPLAGREKSGAKHAKSDLFDGKTSIVVPLENQAPNYIESVHRFWQALGARTIEMDAISHDQAMAAVSHLPHLLASLLSATTSPEQLKLASSGFRDTTRIAAGDPDLWTGILLDNRDYLLEAIDHFDSNLSDIRQALNDNDGESLFRHLVTGKNHRDALGN